VSAAKPHLAAVDLLTIPEAAEAIGSSRQHVYDLINSGELPYVNTATRKAGKTKKRIARTALAEFYDARTGRAPRRRTRASSVGSQKASAA
jgi:excisionase family DNA binding protein